VVFDGPAFNGWRIERMNHAPLVKLTDEVVFVVVARSDAPITQLKQLAGHRVCAIPAPDAGALSLLSQFDNPARQPVIAEAKDWQDSYKRLMEGKCAGSVMPQKVLSTLDRKAVKVIYQHKPLPNQTVSTITDRAIPSRRRSRDLGGWFFCLSYGARVLHLEGQTPKIIRDVERADHGRRDSERGLEQSFRNKALRLGGQPRAENRAARDE